MNNVKWVILCFVLLWSSAAFSQSIDDIRKQKEKAEKEIVYLNKLLKDAAKDKSASTEKVNILQEKIVQGERVLHSLSQELDYLRNGISQNENRIAELQQEKESLLELYANLIYGTWKKRNKVDKLMFILSASDFNQAYNRFRYFQQIQEYSKRQLELIGQVNDSLNVKNKELNRLIEQKNDLLNTMNTKNRELESERLQESRYVNALRKKEKELKKKLDAEMKNRQRLAKELNRLITQQTKKASSSGKGQLTPEEKLLSDDFAKNKGKLPWPVEEGFISEKFGVSVHSLHKYLKISNDGIDITTSRNADVRAVFKGIVLDVCFVPGLNYMILIQHGNYFTAYPNLLDVKVKKGDAVETKQVLGKIGYDSEKGSVLNFQIWQNVGKTQPVKLNPELWLAK